MVNTTASMGVGDWPAPPRPPSDYGYGSGGGNSSSYRHHQHEEARAAKDLVVGCGLQWWAIGGTLLSNCLEGQISKARGGSEGSKNQVLGSAGSSCSGDVHEKAKSLADKRELSKYTFIATIQVLLGSEQGTTTTTTSSTSRGRVTFDPVLQIKYVDKCRVLYPPTPEGMQMKRNAFWSRDEVKNNQAKWDGHLESYELDRSGYGTPCKCHGCLMDGEETNF
eukprot:g8605.t1